MHEQDLPLPTHREILRGKAGDFFLVKVPVLDLKTRQVKVPEDVCPVEIFPHEIEFKASKKEYTREYIEKWIIENLAGPWTTCKIRYFTRKYLDFFYFVLDDDAMKFKLWWG